jgi:hypothetical protein
MPHCKISLQPNDSAAYIVHHSNAVPGRAVCLLGVSSPDLAVPQGAAIFCLAHRLQERRPCGPHVLT